MLMIRSRLMKDIDDLKKMLEADKDHADMIYSKVMAVMGVKCYHKITPEVAREFVRGLFENKTTVDYEPYVGISINKVDTKAGFSLEEHKVSILMNIVILIAKAG